jgi:hypothetical protein
MSGLPPRHSFAKSPEPDEIAFQRVEHRKPLLPLSQGFSSAPGTNMASLGTLRHRLPSNLPLSPRGPFMFELFTSPAFLRSTRAWSSARLRLSPAEGSPQRHTLNEPERSEPHGRICGRGRSPALSMTALRRPRRTASQSLSASPLFQEGLNYRIERGDYSSDTQGQPDYFREPPSSRTSDSHRIRLYRHSR